MVYGFLLAIFFAGCSGGDEPSTVTPKPDPDPTPQPETPSVVTDLSNPTKSGVTVEGYDYQSHSMLVKATADKAPKEGDYLVSGISDKAPYGFLLKTTKVVDHGSGTYAVYSVPAKLNEVLKAKGIKQKGWATLTPVNTESRGIATPEKYTSLLKFNETFTIDDDTFVKKDDSKKDESDKDPVENEFKLKLDDELSIVEGKWHYDSDDDMLSGFMLKFYHGCKMSLSGSWKYSLVKSKDLFKGKYTAYKKFTFVVGGVPVVVTFKSTFKMPLDTSLEFKGNVDVYKSKSFLYCGMDFYDDGDICTPLAELGGNYFRMEVIEGDDEQLSNSDYSASSVTAKLSFTWGVHLVPSVGLYGGNYTADDWKKIADADIDLGLKEPEKSDTKLNYLTAEMDLGVDLKMDVSTGLEGPGLLGAVEHFSNDRRLKDTWSCSLESSIKPKLLLWELKYGIFQSSAKFEPDKPFTGKWWDWEGPLLYSDLKSLKLKANNDGSLNITANLKTPLFGTWNETEYGVCIEKYGMTDLRMYKLTDRIKPDKENDNKFTYNLVDANGKPVKLNSFESGATYAIYPYVKDRWSKNYIFRKGTTFIPTESGLKFNTIDDVPGVDL